MDDILKDCSFVTFYSERIQMLSRKSDALYFTMYEMVSGYKPHSKFQSKNGIGVYFRQIASYALSPNLAFVHHETIGMLSSEHSIQHDTEAVYISPPNHSLNKSNYVHFDRTIELYLWKNWFIHNTTKGTV